MAVGSVAAPTQRGLDCTSIGLIFDRYVAENVVLLPQEGKCRVDQFLQIVEFERPPEGGSKVRFTAVAAAASVGALHASGAACEGLEELHEGLRPSGGEGCPARSISRSIRGLGSKPTNTAGEGGENFPTQGPISVPKRSVECPQKGKTFHSLSGEGGLGSTRPGRDLTLLRPGSGLIGGSPTR